MPGPDTLTPPSSKKEQSSKQDPSEKKILKGRDQFYSESNAAESQEVGETNLEDNRANFLIDTAEQVAKFSFSEEKQKALYENALFELTSGEEGSIEEAMQNAMLALDIQQIPKVLREKIEQAVQRSAELQNQITELEQKIAEKQALLEKHKKAWKAQKTEGVLSAGGQEISQKLIEQYQEQINEIKSKLDEISFE